MEEISKALQPYESIVAQTAQWLTIAQMLSPIFMINSMRKSKSTNGMSVTLFLIFLVFSILGIQFGLLINDEVSLNANLTGCTLSIIYVSAYFYYATAEEKSSESKKLVGAIIFTAIILVYSKYEDPDKIEHRFGIIFTVLMHGFIILPVMDSIRAVKEKCTQHLPLPMILTGTAVGLSWFLHGIIINSGFIILQNAVMLVINFIQLSLFAIYPSTPKSVKKED